MWYLALPSQALRRGAMQGKVFMDRPVVLARDQAGALFAMTDLCPHRGIPLSAGKFDGDQFRCAFHGWRFGVDGVCRAIPSLLPDQKIDLSRIKVRTYPCRESQGNIWIYLSEAQPAPDADLGSPFVIPEIGDIAPRVCTRLVFATDLDSAVYTLLDPAHTPYIHEGPLWRKSVNLGEKKKDFVPSPLGFTMQRHEPGANTFIYKLLGGRPTTEIRFLLPGVRLEHIRIGRHHICNFTAATPIDAVQTEVTNLLYWTNPRLNLLTPFISRLARKFLGEDQWASPLRSRTGVANAPSMMINDADVPQKWYLRLKREWQRQQREGGEFVNPVQAATLRWRT
jgi:phenylpropionate dioxygenase-like ring-hydroxylating dioxygenase large terminal subunit